MSPQKQEIASDQITGLGVDPLAVLADHFEASAFVTAPVDSVFAYVDDPAQLSAHMGKSSWMMGGGRMQTEARCWPRSNSRLPHSPEGQSLWVGFCRRRDRD